MSRIAEHARPEYAEDARVILSWWALYHGASAPEPVEEAPAPVAVEEAPEATEESASLRDLPVPVI